MLLMKEKILQPEFFDRNAVLVAKDLLGKYLVRKINGEITTHRIVETEAYEGFLDKASHASRSKTLRNSPMFEKAGTIYVYFTYGMHWILNIVCGPKGHPAAVLIRGLKRSVENRTFARSNLKNKFDLGDRDLSGPGRLTKKLVIDKNLNGKMLGKKSGLWITDTNITCPTHSLGRRANEIEYPNKKFKIVRMPRIGVNYAGPVWSKKLYRFVLQYGK